MADFNKTTNSSSHHDSEYDTASDTPSSGNELQDDDEDDDDFEDEDDDENDDEEDVELDLERQRGDGEEQDGEKKKVDDDEDRSNPQYIPKRGVFYEHDDRTADEPESATKGEGDDLNVDEKKTDEIATVPKKPVKKSVERWSHDRFNANDQAPKSRSELVNSYGYDIRNEDGPPRAHRRRRYAGGPNKYTRKWEDESAYNKMSSQQQRNPRPEDFPELGNRKGHRNGGAAREDKSNNSTADDSQSQQQQRHRSPPRLVRNEKPAENNDSQRATPFDKPRPQTVPSNDRIEKSQRFDNDKRSNDNFESQRQASDRFENRDRPSPRQDRFISGRNNENIERHQNDRFDNGTRGSQRNDRDRPQNDRPFVRNTSSNTSGGGFRLGITEFKNQTRNPKSGDGPTVVPQQQPVQQSTNKPFNNAAGFIAGRPQKYEYEEDVRVEPHKFDFEPTDRMPGDRAITGRQHGSSVNARLQSTLVSNNAGSLPLTNPSLLGNAPLPSLHQQSQPPASQIQMTNEASRPKRYSALRQRSAIDANVVNQQQLPQHVQPNSMVMHDQQQLMMQDPALLMQRQQQLQDQIQLPPPNANYMQQSLPAQQHQQQMLISSQQQPQNVQTNTAQYQAAAYYAAQPQPSSQNDFPVTSVVNQQQPPQPQPNQYSNQYTVGPPSNPPYMSAAPPLPNAYLPQQQQQPPVTVVSAQQQSGSVSYGPSGTAGGVQPQFAPVSSFPSYPPVANYNSVSSGITYYAPQTQPPPRPILPQRRPTNAIPILAPPERANLKNRLGGRSSSNVNADDNDDDAGKTAGAASIGSPENIDHILDNMFVQRAPYKPLTSSVSATAASALSKSAEMTTDVSNTTQTLALDIDAGLSKVSISDPKAEPPVEPADAHELTNTKIGHENVVETDAS